MADTTRNLDIITVAEAGTLDGLFAERVRRTPQAVGYRAYREIEARWRDIAWAEL